MAATFIPALASPASAAGTGVTIDRISFVEDEIVDGTVQELTVDWSLPDNAETPVSFSIPLPEGLTGQGDRFGLTGPDGQVAGECVVTAAEVVCSVDDAFIEANPSGVHGSFTFRAEVWLDITENTEHIFDFGEITATFPVTPNPGRCEETCEYEGESLWKGGWYNNQDDTITWQIGVPAPKEGLAAGLDIEVVEQFDADIFALVTGPGNPRVREATSVSVDRLNRETPNWNTKSSGVTVSADGRTVNWTSVPGADPATLPEGSRALSGSVYLVEWTLKVKDLGKAKDYTNTATVTVEGTETTSVTGEASRRSGSGWIVGANFGRFRVVKELTGDASFATPPSFEVRWSATDPEAGNAVVDGGTALIAPGQDFVSPELFRGTVVTLEEVLPVGPAGVTWAKPVFLDAAGNPADRIVFDAANGNLGTMTQIRLVNEASLDRDTFSAQKIVQNPDGLPLPADTTFDLNYRYPAGDHFPAGSGTLRLPADGTEVTSEPLPIGAQLTLEEPAPAAIPGATWTLIGLSRTELTIGDPDATATIEVTNEIRRDTAAFSLTKQLRGDAAELVDPEQSYAFEYRVPAGATGNAVEGTVSVRAGETVTVDGIPVGGTVTLREVTPEPITGGFWAAPVFESGDSATIIAGETAEFTVWNELSTTPPPVTPPTTPGTPPPPGTGPLAETGAPATGAALAAGVLGVALTLGGASWLLAARRRARASVTLG
ncbi:DUF5979 domain-containing protein [Leucobacter sp. M11]|uniref:DUF5979 domain-containing protein n=1 Tax=Leucobacter sp. M11 TaxID=2993565 RepID=UPI002D7E7C92|nr:DUF5979 domain-containing protein [Leucobacter sp. M11]MEB4615318.1 DUF5979 domain-containing protein [Leucobacter sp. M11]